MRIVLTGIFLAAALFMQAAEDGIKTLKVNGTEVIAIQDEAIEMPVSLFSGVGEDKIKDLAHADTVPASVNVFLLKKGKELILIDTGKGHYRKSNLRKHLNTLGIKPEAITAILITHMHQDHVGGLLTTEGKMAFPNATVYINQKEKKFWDTLANQPPLNSLIQGAYGDKIKTFEDNDTLVAGIQARNATGHTIGMTFFADGNNWFIGDLLHGALLQFPHPTLNADYDMNKELARQTRARILLVAAQKNATLFGGHIPFPGCGTVKTPDKGEHFEFTPIK